MSAKYEFPCQLCDKRLSEKKALENHIRSRHTFERPFKCGTCNKAYASSESLSIHRRTHFATKPFQCGVCSRQFITGQLLRNHRMTHDTSRTRTHKCDKCSKSFFTLNQLRAHQLVHSSLKPFQCEICEKKFLHKGNLKKHRLNVHIRREKSFRCPRCPFKTHGKNYLANHIIKLHDKWKRKCFECIFCKKIAHTRSHLESHLRHHIQERPFFCQICDKEFSATGSRSQHMKRVHSPNRKLEFGCHFCPKRCFDKGDLVKHMRTHTGEKAHKCNECGKDFGTNAELKRHYIHKHTSERPFKCDVCPKRFKFFARLNVHRKLHDKSLEKRSSRQSWIDTSKTSRKTIARNPPKIRMKF